MNPGRLQLFQRRNTCGHRQRIAAQCTRLIHRPIGCQHIHHLRAPPQRPHPQAAPDDFTKATQVRRDAKPLLSTAKAHAKTRHHLIKNKQRPARHGNFTQELQKSRPWQIQPCISRHRLKNNPGNLPFICRKGLAHRCLIVERHHHGVRCEFRWNPGAVRFAKRQCP